MAISPKQQHWQNVVLEPSGVVPGGYNPAQITVNDKGIITSVAVGVTSSIRSIPTTTELPTILTPDNGEIVIILNDGSNETALYTWNSNNTDVGPPLNRWKRLSTTAIAAGGGRLDYRTGVMTQLDAPGTSTFDTPIPNTGIVKEVSVEIVAPWTEVGTIEIQNSSGSILMPAANIDATTVGTYTESLAGNRNDMAALSGGQLQAVMVGTAPDVFNAVIFVTWVIV